MQIKNSRGQKIQKSTTGNFKNIHIQDHGHNKNMTMTTYQLTKETQQILWHVSFVHSI